MQLGSCDVYRLKEIAETKRLVCFGAGKEFHDFFTDFGYLHLEDNIYAVVDNDAEKVGKTVSISNMRLPIIDIEQLLCLKNIVLLISCADVEGILEQLEGCEALETVPCFYVHLVRSVTSRKNESCWEYPKTFRILKEPCIPKKIHYCWFGGREIPPKNREWMESWKRYCPDYEIIRWDETNYDITKNRYMYEAFQKQKWGFVSDYARIDIVYHQGGIYLDTDVELVKSWENLRYQEAFMGIETNLRINLGLGFGSVQYFPLWRKLLDMYNELRFVNEDGTWNQTPCPQLQNPVYMACSYVNSGELQKVAGASVYPAAVLSPKDLYTGEVRLTLNTYSIHHYAASWVDDSQQIKMEARKALLKKFRTYR